ncbi:response regulator [Kiloniella majae]|uniref:response regulator n=1 Tax=Kiloniella majae TaxID=1938558 RepID=UPI000A278133|nr:response regulator [Kiloniella majae]
MKADTREVTLLLVEDDDIDAASIERSFLKQRIGNSIVRAHDGIEALELLKNGAITYPFMILLDLQMPRMNGLEFLTKLREDSELHDTIVFVLTTSKSDQDIVESYHKKVAGYFVKEEAGVNFIDVVHMFENYWRVLHVPTEPRPV